MKWRFAMAVLGLLSLALPGRAEMAAREGFVDVPGGPVWYRVAGAGDGIPLLALHGGPGGTSCSLARLEVLGDSRPVVRYDQLGSGRSGRPTDTSLWNVARYVEALHTIRSELGLEQLHLLGHSWGAALAAAYVLEKGTEGVVSVTFSSPLLSTPRWIADANELRSQLPEPVQATLREHEAAGTLDSEAYREATKAFYARHVTRGEEKEPVSCGDAPRNELIYRQMWGPTEFLSTGTLREFDVTAELPGIDIPVLFITGEFDEARPETVASFQRQVPGARLEVIPGVAHASLSRAPEVYRQVLSQFLDSVEAAGER